MCNRVHVRLLFIYIYIYIYIYMYMCIITFPNQLQHTFVVVFFLLRSILNFCSVIFFFAQFCFCFVFFPCWDASSAFWVFSSFFCQRVVLFVPYDWSFDSWKRALSRYCPVGYVMRNMYVCMCLGKHVDNLYLWFVVQSHWYVCMYMYRHIHTHGHIVTVTCKSRYVFTPW